MRGHAVLLEQLPVQGSAIQFPPLSDETTPSLKLMRNPDVTVRSRGVMEKCTYCVQRINAARITADIENRPVGGDEVVTACQAACPTQAIVFGNSERPGCAVVKAKASPRNYALARRTEYPSAHNVSGQAAQSQPRDRGRLAR